MADSHSDKELCSVCKERWTGIHAEVGPGMVIHVCEQCLELAKEYFIWICMGCGKVYVRPKAAVIKRLPDIEARKAYARCADLQIIQGIDRCIECDPEGIMDAVDSIKLEKCVGMC